MKISRISDTRLQRERLRLLSGVAGERFTSGINTQLLCATRAKLVLRQHSQHRFAYYLFGTALQHVCGQPVVINRGAGGGVLMYLADSAQLQELFLKGSAGGRNFIGPPGPAGESHQRKTEVGHPNLFRVDHDYVVARIDVRRKCRLVLADQQPRNSRSQPAQHLPVRVHYKPILPFGQRFRFSALWNIRPHQLSHTFPSKDKR